MATINLTVNGQAQRVEVSDSTTPLLWILRDELGLVGTKYGCGRGLCGACTIMLNGIAMRSCQLPIAALQGQSITTIEGLASPEGELTALQQAWIEEDVPQCGYCQSGQIMTATALLRSNPDPDDDAIDSAMAGNLCRCGTYPRIRKAIHKAAEKGVSAS
ncbi:MAG: (2Fe-2S)-binding protein [Puniceicoccaceae bacterium]